MAIITFSAAKHIASDGSSHQVHLSISADISHTATAVDISSRSTFEIHPNASCGITRLTTAKHIIINGCSVFNIQGNKASHSSKSCKILIGIKNFIFIGSVNACSSRTNRLTIFALLPLISSCLTFHCCTVSTKVTIIIRFNSKANTIYRNCWYGG